MKVVGRSIGFSIIFCLSLIWISLAQDNLRNELFGNVDKILAQARDIKANLLAPNSFEKAMEYYIDAENLLKQGKNLEDIREKIKNATAYFAKSLDEAKAGEIAFKTVVGARNDAEKAGAWKYSSELWKKAEYKFDRAARGLEDKDAKSAKETGAEAEGLYRTAELEAIKSNYLSPARELLKKAEETDVEDNAPRTMETARSLSTQVENILKQNRYDTDEARLLADQAKYEAAHSIYLNSAINMIKDGKKSYEDILLAKEFEIKRVASVLSLDARFDSGSDIVINNIVSSIKEKDRLINLYIDSLRQSENNTKSKEEEIVNLKQQITLMTQRLGTLSEAEMKLQEQGKELQLKLDKKHEQELTIKKVSGMFAEEEGTVLREGDKIIIRLYGLTFPVGKSTIMSEHQSLLGKVQEAIKQFPRSRILVEGHTDSQGSDEVNQSLSEKRANAVAEYLMANMSVELPINSEGFGETKPVASNDTAEGRAKNRRIDIVITPEWAESR